MITKAMLFKRVQSAECLDSELNSWKHNVGLRVQLYNSKLT